MCYKRDVKHFAISLPSAFNLTLFKVLKMLRNAEFKIGIPHQ